MSGILNAVGAALGYGNPEPEEVAIVIGGMRIIGWATVAITRSVEQFPPSFVVTAVDQYANDPARRMPFKPGVPCSIYIGADLVITGRVDNYHVSVAPSAHTITIAGRGLGAALVDCSADLLNTPELAGGAINAGSALDLAQKLCKGFGITARTPPGTDLGKPIIGLSIPLGETSYHVLERVCRYAQRLIYEDQNGNLVLDELGTKAMASGFILGTEAGNIESASSTLSIQDRFSDYVAVFHTIDNMKQIAPLGNQLAHVQDETMPSYRLYIFESEQLGLDGQLAQQRADWEKGRRIGRSQAINLTCDSWRDSAGMLWQPNMLAPIDAEVLGVVDVQWLIGDVTFRKDASGTHADVTLMPKEAFQPEPAPLYPFDNQIYQALQPGGAAASPITNEPPGGV